MPVLEIDHMVNIILLDTMSAAVCTNVMKIYTYISECSTYFLNRKLYTTNSDYVRSVAVGAIAATEKYNQTLRQTNDLYYFLVILL